MQVIQPYKENVYWLQPVDIEKSKYHSFTTNEISACSYYTTNTEQAQQESEDFVKEIFTMTTNIPEMLGIKETAEKFGISQNYARQLALSGTVKVVRVGKGKILINAWSVADFFNNNYINAPKPTHDPVIKPIPVNL